MHVDVWCTYRPRSKSEDWKKQRERMKHGHKLWRPKKRLTRHEMDHLRTLREEQPDVWPIPKLATTFGISVSAVTRILRSKFEPLPEVLQRQDAKALQQKEERRKRWSSTTHKDPDWNVHQHDPFPFSNCICNDTARSIQHGTVSH